VTFPIGEWWPFRTKPVTLVVSEIFNSECDAMADMTVNDL